MLRVHGKNVVNFAPPVMLAPLVMRQVRVACRPFTARRLFTPFLTHQSRGPPRAPLAFLEPDLSDTRRTEFLPVPLLTLSAGTRGVPTAVHAVPLPAAPAWNVVAGPGDREVNGDENGDEDGDEDADEVSAARDVGNAPTPVPAPVPALALASAPAPAPGEP